VNGKVATSFLSTDFSSVMDSLNTFNTLTVGAKRPSELDGNFDPKTSFQGQIRNFLFFPFEVPLGNLTESLHPMRVTHRRATTAKMLRESQPKQKFDRINPERLFEASVFNLNVFARNFDIHESKSPSNLSSASPILKKRQLNSNQFSTDLNSEEKTQMSSKGVFYFETSKFEDTLFAVGGLDAFLFCIGLLASFEGFKDPNHPGEILCEILKILEFLTQNSYKEDSLTYLQNNGIYEVIYLIQQVSFL